ncbi:luciferase family oxidoreductase group 1 [Williamsia limnetica]|uniref:Luciferase family oxidoreductase group 1 n=1 Tax=Williamsia limnetica TaxID=882452 RepID=A0A318RIN3_WILLI|nr:LLM class flavin-dependent oxidoreductase [Williamsia limnetica]PYE15152.1 luciferase family oxidoreductase group 1 [Williamsia limnetica]
MGPIPLSVLDLLPRSSGVDNGTALRNTVDLAQRAEQFGYARYWFAEHHLNPGVLGSSPTVEIALVAGSTSTIRLGSAGVQFGHRTPLAAVEEFGLINALHPGRLDLGIGRSISRPEPKVDSGRETDTEGARKGYLAARGGTAHDEDAYTPNGLLLPKQFDISSAFSSNAVAHLLNLLQQPGAYAPSYDDQISTVLALLDGTYVSPQGLPAHAAPGEGADVQVWILGASGGSSAAVAGSKGLRFVAGYHHSPSTVIDAVEAYRAAFQPSDDVPEPYVAVSVDAVVAETDEEATELASGYAPWVRSIRRGDGAIPFPTPAEAAALSWTDEDRDLVRDRVLTQFAGSPKTVADKLEQLRDATGASEISITSITHDHDARVRSYELIAKEWADR